MDRVDVRLTQCQMRALRRMSTLTGRSVAGLIREGVDKFLSGGTGISRKERLGRASGRGVPRVTLFVDTSGIYAVLDRGDADHPTGDSSLDRMPPRRGGVSHEQLRRNGDRRGPGLA